MVREGYRDYGDVPHPLPGAEGDVRGRVGAGAAVIGTTPSASGRGEVV